MAEKPHLNTVFIGHVDHGKSTLVGRLMYDTGNVPDNVMRKYEEQAEEAGKKTFEFAFVMDQLKEERERGLTIDVAHKRFDTDNFYITIIDAPGHRDFVKNMITGTSQADAAILVVSAKDGVQAQTKEHSTLAKTLGIGQMIVAINKMDEVDYKEERFKEVKQEVLDYLEKIGLDIDNIPFLPTSAYYGDNVAEESENMEWWEGPTLVEAIDQTFEVPEKEEKYKDLPLRIPIQDAYNVTGVGTVPVGRVETGVLNPGDKVVFMPSNVTGEVKTIEMHHEEVPEANPGDNVGFNVRGVSKEDVRRGDVAGLADNPPTVVKKFKAQIVVLNHPTVIAPGYSPVFHAHTSQKACRITKLLKKVDPKTGEAIEEEPDFIKTGDAAIVEVVPNQPMVVEEYKEIPPLGRFAIRDMGMTVGVGMVIDVTEK